MKSTLKRFLSLVLCMCMVMALLPNVTMTAFAATSGTVTGLADENIGLSFTGDADDAWSANGTSITGAVTSTSAGCSDTVYKSTLTITNMKSTTATLSFDYSIEQNKGKIQVDGKGVSSGASFTKELAANESVKVYIESGSSDAATKITLTNVVLVSDVNATATFVPAENGTYTVDGKLITEEYSNTQSSMTAYQVVATPADGYQFMGWYDVSNKKYISTSAKAALNIDSDCTITARFASKTAALFETGGQPFDNLGDAVTYAQANGQSKITLAADGSISGSYTIPAGITLLIPFDAAGTLYTDAPAAIRTTPESKPFRTLTMSEGTSITVNGAISLGGRYFAAGGGQQGRPVGDYGYIKMADNSSITVKNGGKLYAWGFISGSGSVLAESGATVYEFYQIADFRGGSASSNMGNKVFPFSQYFVQNIEVPLTLNAGANEQVYSGVYAMSSTFSTAINFIGDNGMFKVESGSFTKDYDEKTDRLVFTVNGEAALNTLSLKLASMSVNSASYVLPITNNITINIQSGNVTINQDAALLAGVEVNIAEGAGLTVSNGKNVYIYDSDEWNSDNFVWGPCKFKSVAYAPGKAYNRSNNDLVDAKMDVNGSVTAIGAIYTTGSGADICSSNGTGKYIQQGTPGTEAETYQYNANGNKAVTIPITAAKLHNSDGSYTETATANAGDVINYVNGVWGGEEPVGLTVTFEANGNAEYPVEGTMNPQTVNAKTDTALNANSFTREGYSFTGWNTKADGTGTPYADKAIVSFDADTTLYAQWTVDPVITFVANDGEGTMGTQTVKPNKATVLTANTFTRADYDFTGWNTAADGTGKAYADKANITTNKNVTLYAQWTLHKYHVRWLNWDGEVLQKGDYTIEDPVSYDGDIPKRPEDDDYTYKFRGWDPSDGDAPENIHEDRDYKAQFNQFKKLTVTFDANDGNGTMEPVKIANGASGMRYTLPECTFTREGYDFAGWLITGTVSDGFDDPFKVEDEQWGDTWLYAFSDLTLKASWADNHSLTEVRGSREPTCTEEGYTGDTYCKVCDKVQKKGESIPAKGHSWNEGEITTAPTCENAGVKTYTCTVCNATKTEAINATGHTPVDVAKQPATCTEAGHTAGVKCSVCGATISGIEVIPATGHKPEIRNAVEATLTTPGYTGDTYCSVCNELLKQGTEIPKTGAHITWVIDGKVVAEEDYLKGTMPSFKGSTDKAPDENYRYTFTGWSPEVVAAEEDATYTAQYSETARVFYTITFNANGGEGGMEPQRFEVGVDTALNTNTFTREGYKFIGWNTAADGSGTAYADEGAILELTGDMTLYAQWQFWNGWFTDVNGKQYYKDGELQKTGWTVIDDKTYYLDTGTGYAATGIATLIPDGATEEARCVFDAEGVFQSDVTGVYTVGNDTYWLNSGIIEEEAGLKRVVKENGEVNYYYFAVAYNLEEQDWLVLSAAVNADNLHGEKCWLHKTNNLLPAWFYEFDENGVIPHEDTKINGIQNVGGTLYYYIDGIKAPAGMIQIDNDIYYVNSKAQLVCGQDYYCSRTNDLKEPGYYTFDADGKMVRPSLNGIVKDDDGVLRYYVNGKVTYVGLIEINGDYYYVRSNGEVVTNCTYYITWTHDLKEPGYYVFDAEGKLIGMPKNGIVEEDGTLRYYANGEPTYVGLIKIGRDYYYVNSKCEVVHSCTYYVSWTHGLIPEGKYTFDAKGRMMDPPAPEDPTKSGIVEENGALYYYESGVKVYAGLIQIDGDYYYVNSSCKVVTTKHYWVNRPNDLLPAGFYDFGEDGKMLNPPKPVDHTKSGIVTENGTMYYYVDGVKTYAGLIQIDGDYYYVNSSCKVVTTPHYWVNRPNDLLPAGFYDFGEDGKMLNPPTEDGKMIET